MVQIQIQILLLTPSPFSLLVRRNGSIYTTSLTLMYFAYSFLRVCVFVVRVFLSFLSFLEHLTFVWEGEDTLCGLVCFLLVVINCTHHHPHICHLLHNQLLWRRWQINHPLIRIPLPHHHCHHHHDHHHRDHAACLHCTAASHFWLLCSCCSVIVIVIVFSLTRRRGEIQIEERHFCNL